MAVLLSATLAGCAGAAKPHVLRYATGADLSSLNPHLDPQGAVEFLSSMTMAWLIKYGTDNRPYAELATEVPTPQNGGVSRDGLTITYHLRRGIHWSDGAPFDAADVAFTVRAVLNPANNEISRTGWDQIRTVEAPDPYTVRLRLKSPYSPFLGVFFSTGNSQCVLPKHILGNLPDINKAEYNQLPVGIGPFKYKEWRRGERVVLVSDPTYFRGPPRLREIDFQIVPDANTLAALMQAHEIDMWYRAPSSFFLRLIKLPGLTSLRHPGFEFNHLDFNTTRPAVRDPRVRLALEYATDRELLQQKIDHGLGVLQEEPAPPGADYFAPSLAKQRPFDLAKAGALLDAAGWKLTAAGVRARDGMPLSIELALGIGNPDSDRRVEILRAAWRQIGISLTAKHYNSALLFAPAANGGIVYGGKFDVAMINNGTDPSGDFSSLFACDQAAPRGQNVSRWCNRRADAAMRDLYRQYTAAGRRADDAILMRELQRDVPLIVTSIPDARFILSTRVKNFHPGSVSSFDNMLDVDVE